MATEETMWDNPTMSTSKVDSKKRLVLPDGQPGDVFDIQRQAEGCYLLVRLEKPERSIRLNRETCLDAMSESPLQPTMTWEELRDLTRKP